MPSEIFISFNRDDKDIAEALSTAINELFGDAINVISFISSETSRGVRHGQNWFQWISDHASKCDFAFVLLTPSSIDTQWVLWEAGVIYGVSLTNGKDLLRPIVYQIQDNQVPSPISHIQWKRGDRSEPIIDILTEILEQYKPTLKVERVISVTKNLESAVTTYLKQVEDSLLMGPLKKMANQYLEIDAPEWDERTRKKNETALKMGSYVITQHLSKQKLANEENEGILLALAEAIYISPEVNDTNFLFKIKNKITRLHIKFRILRSIEQLIEKGRLKKENIPGINEILKNYSLEADDSLLKKIDLVQDAMRLL